MAELTKSEFAISNTKKKDWEKNFGRDYDFCNEVLINKKILTENVCKFSVFVYNWKSKTFHQLFVWIIFPISIL